MKYIDESCLIGHINNNPISKKFISTIKEEVDIFFNSFNDDATKVSRWAHHYFCKDDGGLLIFDIKKPTKHVCSICGRSYEGNKLLDGVWHTMYRNLAATNAWKSAVVYKYNGDKKYLENVVRLASFYADNYMSFKLHNKEALEFDSIDDAKWGSSRIMPQALNEAIFIIRLVNALEIIKGDLTDEYIARLEDNLFKVMFEEMKPQIDQVHNIRCWLNSAIGIMGLFSNNTEMVNFAFNNAYNIKKQLLEGVTEDGFWYEGSIHYNFFLLEGIVNLLLFCKIYGYEFSIGESIVENMLIKAYNYAFDNHRLPNPNDGWPNVNLKTYSYIYAVAARIYGNESLIADILANIVKMDGERATIPLSKPYYYNNDISLEEFLFAQGIRQRDISVDRVKSYNFGTSYCGLIKSKNVNIFIKYGHNGPSHAHPDKMNIEVMLKGKSLSRDLSNSGYGNPFCNQWHRQSASHNTVVADGKSHSNISDGGICHVYDNAFIDAECKEVYKGINYRRNIKIIENGFKDEFRASSKDEHIYDYLFHVEGKLLSDIEMKRVDLGFTDNGYEHIKDVKQVDVSGEKINLSWDIKGVLVKCNINLRGKQLYIAKSPDNPVDSDRYTIIVREVNSKAVFNLQWEME